MVIKVNNLTVPVAIGSASMKNDEFLTFDALTANKYSLIIPSLPNVQFFLQTFEMPEIRVNEVSIPSRFVDYNEIGEKLIFEPFTATFLIDKFVRNWTNVYNWMKAMTVSGSNVGKSDNIILGIGGVEFIRFNDAWPTSLSGIEMSSTLADVKYVAASVTFNYDYLDVINQFSTEDSVYK